MEQVNWEWHRVLNERVSSATCADISPDGRRLVLGSETGFLTTFYKSSGFIPKRKGHE